MTLFGYNGDPCLGISTAHTAVSARVLGTETAACSHHSNKLPVPHINNLWKQNNNVCSQCTVDT